ncbi:sensor histidine kinase [Acidisphaera rubrifaciens]|uniref:histidine kinase n=1 Tax=Acidisphaera rubrifaciens HS-AP3 TaxID=1231350 RepID=A0A0D6P8P7_9PROT|nr:histidine kinase dimerization/phosphoacceptor domain -containing protein [Acidisphaera rubrifaciens]GAN78120.1 signal transduction histidine kinase [Acidisphaera rubrifaciens HS-AP3]
MARQQPLALDLNLALAVIVSSSSPVLLLDDTLTIIAASSSFSHAFQIDPANVTGGSLLTLGHGEWNVRQLVSLLKATADGYADIRAYEMDLIREGQPPRRLVINAQKLEYGAGSAVRLLLTVSDITEARIAEALKATMLREMEDIQRDKATLLRELQHRVANSLQIIASVLLQSARRVQSDETRSHLHDAHQRVMSVAAVQRQLAASSTDDVVLRPYLVDLCASLGASMIRDHTQISLDVSADGTVISADVSISLGLIVTELVINALKHAFPDDRPGRIMVDYHAHGPDWTLSVADDGIGMTPSTGAGQKIGLGTSIVAALARQLHATVNTRDTNPGTDVSIVHTDADDATPSPEGIAA